MFTGIVERTGTVRAVVELETTRRLALECGTAMASELSLGDSVAVDGACFTVTDLDADGFHVDVIAISLGRTIAGTYREGSVVNLERALRADGRMDGHFVTGHIDGVGALERVARDGEFWRMEFRIPDEVAALTVERGSITLNGVSLTVAGMPATALCAVGLIPYTREHTNLGGLRPGDPVNVEGDLIGKYVGKILAARQQDTSA
jgi:riboflavin synthase